MIVVSNKMHQRILDSARNLYIHASAGFPSMDEVAREAGVGRATIYRYFSNRDELLVAVLEEEANRIATIVEKKIRRKERAGEYIIEGIVQAREEINRSELFNVMFTSNASNAVNRLLLNSDRLTNIGLDIMLPVVQRAQQRGELGTDMPFDMLVEWIMRMLISLLSTPSKYTQSTTTLRKMLRKTMLPVLARE